jgi:hypothetical protein
VNRGIAMFSDRFRFSKIFLLGISLLALSLASYAQGFRHFEGISRMLDGLHADEGAPVKIAFAKVVKLLGEERILVSSRGIEFEVRTPRVPIRTGQRVSVSGRLCKEGHVKAETITIHRYRWVKKLVSTIAALIVCLLVFTHYRISFEDRCIVERGPCQTS